MYDELVGRLREPCQYENCILCQQAADAIEELQGKADAYLDAMTYEHNRAARLLWDKEHCWIPVTERLPKEGEFVLVYGDLYPNKHDGGVIAVSKRMDWNYWQGFGRERNISHWMPLPTPPTAEEGE